jgi:hypothetical protein
MLLYNVLGKVSINSHDMNERVAEINFYLTRSPKKLVGHKVCCYHTLAFQESPASPVVLHPPWLVVHPKRQTPNGGLKSMTLKLCNFLNLYRVKSAYASSHLYFYARTFLETSKHMPTSLVPNIRYNIL